VKALPPHHKSLPPRPAESLRDLAVELCRLVRVKKPHAPPSHSVPQLAVVVSEDERVVYLMAQNLPALKKRGKVLARTLHQHSWKPKYGSDPAYRDCVEVADVEPNPSPADWDSVIEEFRARGYRIEATKSFQ